MKTLPGRMRIFATPGSPTVAMSATATEKEISSMVSNLGLRNAPVILKASPIQNHIKFVTLQRPSNNCGSFGRMDKEGKDHPGLVALLKRIYLDTFISNTRLGLPSAKCIIFFRTESHMFDVNDFIGSELPHLKGSREMPYVMNHGGLGPITSQDLIDRRNEITLFLSTSKMLMRIDIENIDVVIFVRVLCMLHYIVQGAGRGGRRSVQYLGMRRKVVVYILYNSSDVAANVPGLAVEVREFCKTKECLKKFLGNSFDRDAHHQATDWCCGNCNV